MSKSRAGIKYGYYIAMKMDDVNLKQPSQNGKGNVLTQKCRDHQQTAQMTGLLRLCGVGGRVT